MVYRRKCNVGKYALHGTVGTRQYAVDPTDVDVVEYVRNNADDVRHHLDNAIRKHRSVKWYSTIDIGFQRTTSDGDVQHTTARFRTQPNVISDTSNVSVNRIAGEFLSGIDNFNRRGSNWIVESVLHFHITFAPFRPTQGSSFIPTPREIAVKQAIINVQNYDDHLCFLWSILAALYSVRHEQNPSRQYHYKPYLSKLNVTGLSFPLPVKDVAKFERLNPDIAVNVLVYEERELIPLYVSPHRDRKHTIPLLLLSDENNHHYCLVKSLSRLFHGRTKHTARTFVCPYCFHCFSEEHVLSNHIPTVPSTPRRPCRIPRRGKTRFCIIRPSKKNFPSRTFSTSILNVFWYRLQTDSVSEHVPSGFCCLKVSKFIDEIFEPYVYSGPDVLSKFYDHIYAEQKTICAKLNIQMDMLPLTDEEKSDYENASTCPNCKNYFD